MPKYRGFGADLSGGDSTARSAAATGDEHGGAPAGSARDAELRAALPHVARLTPPSLAVARVLTLLLQPPAAESACPADELNMLASRGVGSALSKYAITPGSFEECEWVNDVLGQAFLALAHWGRDLARVGGAAPRALALDGPLHEVMRQVRVLMSVAEKPATQPHVSAAAGDRGAAEVRLQLPQEVGEEAKALGGSARVNLVSFREMRQRDPRASVAAWSRSETLPGTTDAPAPPTEAIQFMMADEVSRATAKGEIVSPEVRERVDLELGTREELARQVLGEALPHAPKQLRKKLLLAVQALRLTEAPRPPAFARVVGEPDYFGTKTEEAALSPERVFGLVLNMAAAFWSEFDWSFVGDLRHELLETTQGGGKLAVKLAEALYSKAMRQIQAGADLARLAPASETLQGRRLMTAAQVTKWLRHARDERRTSLVQDERVRAHTAELAAEIALLRRQTGGAQDGSGGKGVAGDGAAHKSPAGQRATGVALSPAARTAFRLKFGGKCMYYIVTGACSNVRCPDLHEPVAEEALKEWVVAQGGRMSR